MAHSQNLLVQIQVKKGQQSVTFKSNLYNLIYISIVGFKDILQSLKSTPHRKRERKKKEKELKQKMLKCRMVESRIFKKRKDKNS